MANKDRYQPAQRFNYWDGWIVVALEDVVLGNLVSPVGQHGPHMCVKLADEDDTGKLFIAKHDTPGQNDADQITEHNYGVILPDLVLVTGVDTTKATVLQPVYLGRNGQWTLKAGKRIIGKVLRIGPASDEPEGLPGCGAILLSP